MPANTASPVEQWEDSIIEYFVSIGDTLGFPRSMVQIYGLLYCSVSPISMEEISIRLQISKGSVSQGLKQLSMIGAIKRQTALGERRTLYLAERSMKRLLSLFIETQLNPRLESSSERILEIGKLIPSSTEFDYARKRTESLMLWHQRLARVAPVLFKLVR